MSFYFYLSDMWAYKNPTHPIITFNKNFSIHYYFLLSHPFTFKTNLVSVDVLFFFILLGLVSSSCLAMNLVLILIARKSFFIMLMSFLTHLAFSARFEPSTYCLEGNCSIQLSYWSLLKYIIKNPINQVVYRVS